MEIRSYQGAEAEKAGRLYDLRIIEEFCRGNQDKVSNMIKTFIAQIPNAVEEIRRANAGCDFAEIKNVAHRIKPVLRYFAVSTIEENLCELEGLAQIGIFMKESIELKIEKLDAAVQEVIKQMQETVNISNNIFNNKI